MKNQVQCQGCGAIIDVPDGALLLTEQSSVQSITHIIVIHRCESLAIATGEDDNGLTYIVTNEDLDFYN